MVVKRVGPLSVAKNVAVLYALIGLILGAFFSFAAMAGAFTGGAFGGENSGAAAGIAGLIGVGAIVMFPIIYACLGFVFSLIAAALYNAVAGMVGGIELEVE